MSLLKDLQLPAFFFRAEATHLYYWAPIPEIR